MKKIFKFVKKFINNYITMGFLFCVFNLLYVNLACVLAIAGFLDLGRGVNIPLLLIVNLNVLIPVVAFILYVLRKTYKDYRKVFKLFYGIEMPLILICLLRIFLLREITPFIFMILASVVVAVGVQIVEYYNIKKLKSGIFMVLGYETTVILGTYGLILASFFVLPFLFGLLQSFFSFGWFDIVISSFSLESLLGLPTILISMFFMLLFFGGFIVAIISPFVSAYIYLKSFIKYTKRIANKRILANYAVIYFLVMALLSFQPSETKFLDNISKYRQALTYEDKVDIAKKFVIGKELNYKNILTNKYIAKYRYYADKTNSSVYNIHDNEAFGQICQNMFNFLAFPFIYNGQFDPASANADYQELFDKNIQSAQKNKIRKALYSTLFGSETAATVLDKDAKSVLLKSRITKVFTSSNSPIVRVNITEEYFNKDTTDKEVFYYLTLPQGAVVTDLKLGKDLEYQGEISTKGAARKTYEGQVVNRHDPALLEKNGLRQYTLRVYPVQTKDYQKISYDYLTTVNEDGSVKLPEIYEKRNVYKNSFTTYKYEVNGNSVKDVKANVINVESGFGNYNVCSYIQKDLYCLKNVNKQKEFKNKRIALLLDTSYSNRISWKNYLSNNQEYQNLTTNNSVDAYYFNDLISKKIDMDNAEQYNIGKTKRLDAIKAVEKNYDIVIMLTDSDDFDKSERVLPDEINAPVYIIHADNKIPPYYNELALSVLKSNGKIADSIKDVVNDYSFKQNSDGIYSDNNIVLTKESKNDGKIINDADFTKYIYSKIIDNKIAKEDVSDISILDKIHEIAKSQGIVTSYSSYIALVDKWQKKELKANEKSSDRFEANLQSGIDKTVNESDEEAEDIKAVPEPEQWAMIIMGIVLLLFMCMKRNVICKKF